MVPAFVLAGVLIAGPAGGGDRQRAVWGNDPSHNMVLDAKGLPERFDETTLLWEVETGAKWGFAMPTVVDGLVLHGTGRGGLIDPRYDEALGGSGAYTCRDLKTGKPLWQVIVPCNTYNLSYGVCTTPVIEGRRVYILALGEMLCLDLDGLENGNQGMGPDAELRFQTSVAGKRLEDAKDIDALPTAAGDIIWRFSLWDLGVGFHDATACAPLLLGDQLWITTSHIVGSEIRPTERNAPHVIVLDKDTGRLIARDRMDIPYIYHGAWSSPSLATVGGRKVVVYADGYGMMHGLAVPGKPAKGEEVATLKELWRVDLNPREYRYDPNGKEIPYTEDKRLFRRYPPGYGKDMDRWAPILSRRRNQARGPCDCISMPACIGDRIYIGIGRDCYYTTDEAPGRMMCWQLTGPAKAPKLLWESRKVYRTHCTASVADGLVYVADIAGLLHCLDADTGEQLWQADLGKKVITRSQMIADGKVYVANEKREMHVFRHGRRLEKLGEWKLPGKPSTIEAVDGLIVVSFGGGLAVYGRAEALAAACGSKSAGKADK